MKPILVLFLLVASRIWAQTPAPAVRTQSNLVVVPALVRDAHGALVFNLTANDFRVTDDGVAQTLTLDEDNENEPIALVVAVQTGGLGRDKLHDYENLGSVIDAIVGGVPHRVAIVGFDSTPRLLQDFSSDAGYAGEALDNLDPGDKGAAIVDALRFSVDMLRRQPSNYRRAILLLSETLDHGSQAKLDDALRDLSDTNTAIYAVGFSSGKAHATNYAFQELPIHKAEDGGIALSNAHPNPPHGCMGKDPDPDATTNKAIQFYDCLTQLAPPLALAKMAAIRAADSLQQNVPATVAQLTGGEYFKFDNHRVLVDDLLTLINHVPNRYILSFQPVSPHPGYHVVQLKLNGHRDLRLIARAGYWADGTPPAASQP